MFTMRAGLPWPGHARLAPRMRQLDSSVRSVLMQELHNALQHRDVLVLPDAEIEGSNTAFCCPPRGFCHHQPRPSNGPAAEMNKVPVIGKAILARVLTHR